MAIVLKNLYFVLAVTPLSDPRASDGTPLRRLAIGGLASPPR
ncbi:hypothetical protein [Micromonospora sp. M71_S20]|nr:hypothetical protein [Micromonospora sp. M71_S20]